VVPCEIAQQQPVFLVFLLCEGVSCVCDSWLCTLLMQLNPLFGPQLSNSTLLIMQTEWK